MPHQPLHRLESTDQLHPCAPSRKKVFVGKIVQILEGVEHIC